MRVNSDLGLALRHLREGHVSPGGLLAVRARYSIDVRRATPAPLVLGKTAQSAARFTIDTGRLYGQRLEGRGFVAWALAALILVPVALVAFALSVLLVGLLVLVALVVTSFLVLGSLVLVVLGRGRIYISR